MSLNSKLTGSENYKVWARSMKNLLVIQDLWDFVESDVPGSKNEKAKAYIELNIDPNLLGIVPEEPTTNAKTVWDI